jgi:hypothetical protein
LQDALLVTESSIVWLRVPSESPVKKDRVSVTSIPVRGLSALPGRKQLRCGAARFLSGSIAEVAAGGMVSQGGAVLCIGFFDLSANAGVTTLAVLPASCQAGHITAVSWVPRDNGGHNASKLAVLSADGGVQVWEVSTNPTEFALSQFRLLGVLNGVSAPSGLIENASAIAFIGDDIAAIGGERSGVINFYQISNISCPSGNCKDAHMMSLRDPALSSITDLCTIASSSMSRLTVFGPGGMSVWEIQVYGWGIDHLYHGFDDRCGSNGSTASNAVRGSSLMQGGTKARIVSMSPLGVVSLYAFDCI